MAMRVEALPEETPEEQARSGALKLFSSLVPAGTDRLSVLLVLASLLIVTITVERADWAGTPSLLLLVFLGFLTGFLLETLKLRALLFHAAGLVLGTVTVLWQASAIAGSGSMAERLGELFYRLRLWGEAAGSGGISLDTAPFAFGLIITTWLLGFLAAWALLRRRNMWLALSPGTGGIIANLCYLPRTYTPFLFAYLLVALLALSRAHSVRRDATLRQLGVYRPEWLGVHLLHAAFWFVVLTLSVAFFLPRHGPLDALEASYHFLRSPIDRFSGDLSRLFAGLPARKPMPYKGFGPVFPFRGEANLTTVPVLEVRSPVPMYWKARSYGEYTSTGWKTGNTQVFPSGWLPSYRKEENYKKRYSVDLDATVYFSTQVLFVGGTASDYGGFRIESYDSPIYTIDLAEPAVGENTPADVNELAGSLDGPLRSGEVEALKGSLSPDLVITDVEYDGDYAIRLTLARVLPTPPDVLAVHSRERLNSADTYRISSSVSYVAPEELRLTGEGYPAWVLDRYLSLPPTLPSRVKELARSLTADAPTPYDKALAIAEYLRAMPYTTKIDPPPYDGDGVDHFLFTIKEGYCDYFASALAVMLRSVGVPARLAVGYLPGEEIGGGVYLVRHSDSHAWSEVYFPLYGWVPFEATPGREVLLAMAPQPVDTTPPLPVAGEEDSHEEVDERIPFIPFDVRPRPPGFNPAKTLPWLALPLALGLVMLWLWRRFIAPPAGAEAAYRRLVLASTLAGMGPHQNQTPYEYTRFLEERLPSHKGPLRAVAEAYVKHRYGRKALPIKEQEGLAGAWLALRGTLLLRILRIR